ncbi:MAG: hypothetical protein HQK61_03520 [Desulfamplus sp.]|nr:hypothetical protein [Desulfamplus sp.]
MITLSVSRKWNMLIVSLSITVTMVVLNCIFLINIVYCGDKDAFSKLRLHGYGTIGYSIDDKTNLAPMRDFSQNPDRKFSNNGTWKLDSRLGMQADYRFSDKMEFVLQGVLKDQIDQTPRSYLESAYISTSPYTWMDIRLGRLGYDAFMMSDTRNISYAYLWVRPPPEFYGWIPVFSVDGMDATFRINQGDAQWRIRAQAGKSRDVSFPMGENDTYDVETDDCYTFTISRQSGSMRIKAGYSSFTAINEARPFIALQGGLDAVIKATENAFPDINTESSNLRKNLSFKDIDVNYITIGAAYDDGKWVAQAEVERAESTSETFPLGYMTYLGFGYRLDDFTPYILLSGTFPGKDFRTPSSDWSPIRQEEFHARALNASNSTRIEQKTASLGIRWDFHNQAALKLQWDRTYVDPWGYAMWWLTPETRTHSSKINTGTVSLDFVF